MKSTTKYLLYETPKYGTVCNKESQRRLISENFLKMNNRMEIDKMDDNMLIKEIERLVKENKELDIKCKKKGKLIKGLENQLWEYDEDYDELEEEIKEVKKESENRYNLLIKATDEVINKDEELAKLRKELKEVKSENMRLKMERIAKEMKKCIYPEIIKASQINMKECLNAIELMTR